MTCWLADWLLGAEEENELFSAVYVNIMCCCFGENYFQIPWRLNMRILLATSRQ